MPPAGQYDDYTKFIDIANEMSCNLGQTINNLISDASGVSGISSNTLSKAPSNGGALTATGIKQMVDNMAAKNAMYMHPAMMNDLEEFTGVDSIDYYTKSGDGYTYLTKYTNEESDPLLVKPLPETPKPPVQMYLLHSKRKFRTE